jgi:hypothetical protein
MERDITVRRYAMKLRIKGNSLRIRVTPSEVKQLLCGGEIRDHVQFTAIAGNRLTYELLSSSSEATTSVAYRCGTITVSVSENQLEKWAGSNDVGVYAEVVLGDNEALSVAIEKDFACLDLSDAENEDTFPNPNVAATC